MAKAVTLKNTNNEEVYPVTDISLVNGDITAGRISDGAVTTSKLADKAVTSDKIDWTTFIERGTATVTYQASPSSGGFVAVTFSRTHKTPPMVLAQDVLRTGAAGSVSVSKVTTTGFELLARTTGNAATGTIEWIAFDI